MNAIHATSLVLLLMLSSSAYAASPTTQLVIERVELMPNHPEPFKLKDFKAVARDYDKLVFNFDATGEHLPLLCSDDSRINLPIRTFGLPSYVGGNQTRVGDDHQAITPIDAALRAPPA